MKKLLIALVLMIGCVGSPTPHNPMNKTEAAWLNTSGEPWWRASTIGVSDADNPWNALIPVPPPVKDWTDPWSDYKAPPLFPKGFKPSKTKYLDEKAEKLKLIEENLKLKKVIEGLLAPKVEKSLLVRLKDLRKREKNYFDRSI